MKSIPYEIKQKLLKNIQAKSTDAEPKLRIIATESTTNTLIAETIHRTIPASFGDVAIRQLKGETEPSLAYAICLDNGTANVYERKFPALMENPWKLIWAVGIASEVAIEFNGTWELDANKKCYYLQTEQTPYIFFVQNGTLYVQKWQDICSRISLAVGVSQIAVCRGWQSSDDLLLDQGLIIAYLINGAVYYRALCLQANGETLWETQRQITKLSSGNTSISVFRTNDFRVGFITEKNNSFQYVLSCRTYAGQSVESESLYSQVVEKCSLNVIPISYRSSYDDKKSGLTAKIPISDCYIGSCMQYPAFTVLSTTRLAANQFKITCSHALQSGKSLERYFTLSLHAPETTRPTTASVEIMDHTLLITSDVPISLWQKVTVTLSSYSGLCFLSPQASPLKVPNFTAIFEPQYVTDDNPMLKTNCFITAFLNTPIKYTKYMQDERLSVTIRYNCTLTATQVGTVPI